MIKPGKIFKTFFAVIILIILGMFIRTDYYLVKPGLAEDLRPLVAVKGADQKDEGSFFLVTIFQQQASLPMLIYAYLHPRIDIQKLTHVIPPDMDIEEYQELMKELMRESQLMAKVIALQRAGHQIEIETEGVVIRGFLEDSPSRDIFEEGDIILTVDGQEVLLTSDVITLVQDRTVGEEVHLTVLRGDRQIELVSPTYPHTDDPTLPALGVYISALDWEPVLPFEIEIKTGEITGPSAGLMFVLEILNQIDPDDLTRGHLIAGTGTIDLNENVGRIGGVFQKVIAAERAGAEHFIVPAGNLSEAQRAARKINLVPVNNLQEALDYLEQLPAAAELRSSHILRLFEGNL